MCWRCRWRNGKNGLFKFYERTHLFARLHSLTVDGLLVACKDAGSSPLLIHKDSCRRKVLNPIESIRTFWHKFCFLSLPKKGVGVGLSLWFAFQSRGHETKRCESSRFVPSLLCDLPYALVSQSDFRHRKLGSIVLGLCHFFIRTFVPKTWENEILLNVNFTCHTHRHAATLCSR